MIGEQHCPVQTLKAYIDLIKQPSVLGASSTWSDDDVASLGNLIGLLLVAFFSSFNRDEIMLLFFLSFCSDFIRFSI